MTSTKPKVAPKRKLVKAPQAPRRFKSAYMFFSSEQHREIRLQCTDKKIPTPQIAKMVSQKWKSMSAQEKQKYHSLALQDRNRFENEKASYKGPWKVEAKSSGIPPKQPPSAFLLFLNYLRPLARKQNCMLTGDALTKVIAQHWNEAPEFEKQPFIDNAEMLRLQYREDCAEWQRKSGQSPTLSSLPLHMSRLQKNESSTAALPSSIFPLDRAVTLASKASISEESGYGVFPEYDMQSLLFLRQKPSRMVSLDAIPQEIEFSYNSDKAIITHEANDESDLFQGYENDDCNLFGAVASMYIENMHDTSPSDEDVFVW